MANKINANFTNNKISVSTSSNSKVIVQKGGPVTQLGIGTVTVLAAGEDPTVDVSGAPSNPVLDFGLPASPNELQLLSDVEIADLADGDTIVYSAADAKFKNAQPAASGGSGATPWFEKITATGSVTVPAGVTMIEISGRGGGGAGGGGCGAGTDYVGDGASGGSGGAAGIQNSRLLAVTEGEVLDVTIGAGGSLGVGGAAHIDANLWPADAPTAANNGGFTAVQTHSDGAYVFVAQGGMAGQGGVDTTRTAITPYGVFYDATGIDPTLTTAPIPGSGTGSGSNAVYSNTIYSLPSGQCGGYGGAMASGNNGGSGGGSGNGTAGAYSKLLHVAPPGGINGEDGQDGAANSGNGGGGGGGGAPGGNGGNGGAGGSGLVIIRAVG